MLLGLRTLTKGKSKASRSELESSTKGSNSLVDESEANPREIQSTTGHEEPRGKQGGPPPNAKYSLATDSEQVP
jgi:hypothetical protein